MPASQQPPEKPSFKEETIAKAVARSKSSSVKTKVTPSKVTAFTLDDVQDFLASKKDAPVPTATKAAPAVPSNKGAAFNQIDQPRQSRHLGAASLMEILGYDPAKGWNAESEESKVPRKFMPYYKRLVQLRQHLTEEIDLHTRENLKKPGKGASGGSQPLDDEEAASFDREFALSLVSSEQEALAEIEEAIQRIIDGTYGVCEVTGKRISKERLLAVPFTKYSLKGKQELERNKRPTLPRGGIFSSSMQDSSQFFGDDSE